MKQVYVVRGTGAGTVSLGSKLRGHPLILGNTLQFILLETGI